MLGTGISASIAPAYSFSIPQGSGTSAVLDILAGSKWGTAIGTPATLSYSWSAPASSYSYSFDSASLQPGVVALNASQQQAALAAMQAVSRIANVSFAAADDTSTGAGDVRWAASDDTSYFTRTHASAFAYFPGADARGGDIWLDAALGYFQSPALGSFGWQDIFHELGHAIGLSHPAAQGALTDQLKYTVMSYRDFAGDAHTYLAQYYPTSYMLDDVAALQFLYGANTATNPGNTTYSWDPARPVYETIWDGGGFDTIDASNQRSGVAIDLHAGAWSHIGPAFWNGQYDSAGYADFTKTVNDCLAIAYNCTIEAAIGSAYADTLTGNDAGNLLSGGLGNDTIAGGGGIDVAQFAGTLASYAITPSAGRGVTVASRAHADDTDSVAGDVERLAFSDVTLALDTGGYIGQIYRLYQAAFQRGADAGGEGFYMKQMEQGASLVTLADAFLASPEFQATYGNTSDAQFVTRLYENTLGREATAAEVAFHVDALHTTSRAQLLVNFSESPENQVRTILDATGPAAQVWRLYDAAFDRAPDAAGLVYHVQGGAPLVTLAQQFMASPEFQAKYGATSDTQFATLLYQNVLGRAPDAAGLADQVAALHGGTSRAQMMVNFSESPEHCAQAQFVGVIHEGVAYVPG